MRDLFEPITRDERQNEGIKKWITAKCRATLEYATGVGKTYTAIKAIKAILKKYPDFKILVIVPTEGLQKQWKSNLATHDLVFNSDVQIVNTAIRHTWQCDILVLDEIHRFAADTFSSVFTQVKYRCILGLTATLERLDEKHKILEKYCPICDSIPIAEALANNWVSDYTEYKVILDVDDIDVYNNYNKEFNKHYEFFNFDYPLIMSLVGAKGFVNKIAYRDKICTNPALKSEALKLINYHANGFMKMMQARKQFIYNHPKKLELTREIIKHRPNSKIITFSANTEMAEAIGIGYVYTGKESKKKNRMKIDEFASKSSGVLNTIKKANEGLDIAGLSVAIILGMDSSATTSIQRKGRVIRKEGDKHAEIFTFVINNTVETKWFEKSHEKDSKYITIGEKGLEQVLKGEEPEVYTKPIPKLTFRF